jgi:alpha-tubulin suppressor-like RCC1 family protein/sugar lactone lactonase YvrE
MTVVAALLSSLAVAGGRLSPAAAAVGELVPYAGSLGSGRASNVAQDAYGLAVGGGRLYLADRNHYVVRAVDLATGFEEVVVGTGVSGNDGDGGPATAATLSDPFALAFDASGNLFIADYYGGRIRRVDTAGIITTVAGGGATRDNGVLARDAWVMPLGVAIGPEGDVYFSDYPTRVRKVDHVSGRVVAAVGVGGSSSYGGDGGPATLAVLSSPGALAFDQAGNLFLQDGGRIRRVDTFGTITTVIGNGNREYGAEGPGIDIPVGGWGIVPDAAGNIFVTDHRWVRRLDASGRLATVGGNGQWVVTPAGTEVDPHDGDQARGVALQPWGLARDGAGNLYVSEAGRHRTRRIAPDGVISTIAGNGTGSLGGDGGPAARAQLASPRGLAFDPDSGDLFVADSGNSRLRRITPGGTIWSTADGRTQGELDRGYSPLAVAFGPDGSRFVVAKRTWDQIVRIDPDGVTWPLAGTNGYDPDPGDGRQATDVTLAISGIGVDGDGVVYVADMAHQRIRRIGRDGVITTVAGGGSSFEDGIPAVEAKMFPVGMTLDGAGGLLVLDSLSHRVRVVSLADGTISTRAGSGVKGFAGDGGPALEAELDLGWEQFASSSAIAVDGAGDLFFFDAANRRIRKVGTDGIISSIAGNGELGRGPGAATADPTSVPVYATGLAADADGSLYVSDLVANRVWILEEAGDPTPPSTATTSSTTPSSTTSTSSTSTTVPAPARARGWGFNGYGQVGDGTTTARAVAVAVAPAGTTAVAAGGFHSLALVGNQVWSWGLGHVGQLGTGTTASRSSPGPVPGLTGVTAVSAGVFHSLALKSDGTVWAWGWNAYGQLGTGNTTDSAVPVRVVGLTGVVAVAAGATHSLALRSDGTVWAWGYNHVGQTGTGGPTVVSTPAPVPGLTGITSIAAGGYHSFAVRTDGTLVGWGWNALGQVGDGTTVDRPAPVTVVGVTGVRSVSAGIGHTLAVRSDGSVWSWGYNNTGQLGRAGTTSSPTPGAVPGATGISSVAAGGYHSNALRSDGSVASWGWNTFGQLGDGTMIDRHTPTPAPALAGGRSISAGVAHALVLAA